MIQISKNIYLKEIKTSDTETLFQLMQEIYSHAYSHFWEDLGNWYVNSQYSKENILKELSEQNAQYYFILLKDKIVGNFRIIWDEKLEGLNEEKQVKLHRLYLHQKTQGKGIGKKLVNFLEEKVKAKEYQIVWLDAMNEQPQAFQFYKKLGFQNHSHFFLSYDLMYKHLRKISQLYKKLT